MRTNLVPLDRAMRASGGLLLLATPLLELHTFPYNLLGIIPIATAIAGFCPVYSLGRLIVPKRYPRGPGAFRSQREAMP